MANRSKVNVKQIVAGVAIGAAVIMAGGAAVGVAKLNKAAKTETLEASAYQRFMLDDTTGKGDTESTGGLSTKNFYKYEGLEVELAKDAKVTYQVDYYDKDKKFLGVQDWTTDFAAASVTSTLTGIEYVKIEILPTEDEDEKVSIFEAPGYINQLTVTVKK